MYGLGQQGHELQRKRKNLDAEKQPEVEMCKRSKIIYHQCDPKIYKDFKRLLEKRNQNFSPAADSKTLNIFFKENIVSIRKIFLINPYIDSNEFYKLIQHFLLDYYPGGEQQLKKSLLEYYVTIAPEVTRKYQVLLYFLIDKMSKLNSDIFCMLCNLKVFDKFTEEQAYKFFVKIISVDGNNMKGILEHSPCISLLFNRAKKYLSENQEVYESFKHIRSSYYVRDIHGALVKELNLMFELKSRTYTMLNDAGPAVTFPFLKLHSSTLKSLPPLNRFSIFPSETINLNVQKPTDSRSHNAPATN